MGEAGDRIITGLEEAVEDAQIARQLKWEAYMLELGIKRFRKGDAAAQNRKEFTATNSGRRILRNYIGPLSENIALWLANGQPFGKRRNRVSPLLDRIDPDKLAMFTMHAIVHAIYVDTPVPTLYRRIGVLCEDDARFSKFAKAHPGYFKKIAEQLDRKRTTDYRHRHRVMTHVANKKGMAWSSWPEDVLYDIGATLLGLALNCTDLVSFRTVQHTKRKQKIILVPSEELLEWMKNSDEAQALALPDRMPCLIDPRDWSTPFRGGYYSRELRVTTPSVKTRRDRAGRAHKALLRDAQMTGVLGSLSHMQKTQWEINAPVLDVMRKVWDAGLGAGMPRSTPYDFPACPIGKNVDMEKLSPEEKRLFDNWKSETRELHRMERERQGQLLGVTRTMRVATEMSKYPGFRYVWTTDFRGRAYCATTGASPQGADHAKAVLRFHEGHPVGERGLYWLKVHGANKYGYDKASYDDRVAWVDSNRDKWLACASDPLSHTDVWASKDVDKPFQFLAWILEYSGAVREGASFVSHLPIAFDGACNGLQHFSAMLRDPVGGASVNLTPAAKPADIYQDVADVATRKLREVARVVNEDAPLDYLYAQNWLGLFKHLGLDKMPRKLSKKPVMTLPYGSTMQTCTKSVHAWYKDQDVDFFDKDETFAHAIFMSKLLWASIGEVVIAARAAMSWIQTCSSVLAKAGHAMHYDTPLGFPLYQASREVTMRRIASIIGGQRYRIQIAESTGKICPRKQRQGSSPNLVHSIDATHMHMCVLEAQRRGIRDLAMIHDDFGVHACNSEAWHTIIREQFVKLHSETDVLADFKAQHEARHNLKLPNLPATGSLDIKDVMSSPYFFG